MNKSGRPRNATPKFDRLIDREARITSREIKNELDNADMTTRTIHCRLVEFGLACLSPFEEAVDIGKEPQASIRFRQVTFWLDSSAMEESDLERRIQVQSVFQPMETCFQSMEWDMFASNEH
jgi:hypothetical protein